MPLDSLNAAIDRFFRSYFNHCVAPDEETLLNLLNALHGLQDKLQKDAGRHLFASGNFIALKALRNLFHHQTELIHDIRIIPVEDLPPMMTDLLASVLSLRAESNVPVRKPTGIIASRSARHSMHSSGTDPSSTSSLACSTSRWMSSNSSPSWMQPRRQTRVASLWSRITGKSKMASLIV